MAEAFSSLEYQVAQVYPHYQRALLSHAAVDFDDLLMHTALLLRENNHLRDQLDARYRFVLVDEYQDTNLAQYVILRHLCVNHPNLAATGDPDQSIYGWRGASVQNVAHLERDYPELQVIRLEENYRSTPEILSIADGLIQNNQFRKHKQLVPSRSTGHPVRLVVYPRAREEAEDIADQILSLTQAGEHSLSDFGVLYRTNAQSRLLEQAMLRRNIPYQLIGGFRFYLRKEIKDLVAYLSVVANPDDDIALQRVINVPPRGIGKQSVERLLRLADQRGCSLLEACREAASGTDLSPRARTAVQAFVQLMDSISALATDSLMTLLQHVLDLTEYRDYLSKAATKDRDQHDIHQNIDELMAEAQELDRETSQERPALERFLETVALQADTDRLKTGNEMVTLMTLHAAKGLEFPCVYLVAIEENILPHSRCKEDPMQLEEERRLLFVGITRAKDRLQLSYAKNRGFGNFSGSGVPSSFLVELPRHEMVIEDRCELNPHAMAAEAIDFDECFDEGASDLDDACQLSYDEEGNELYAEDDDSQLPPEEQKERLLRRVKQKAGRKLSVGSKLPDASKAWGRFRPGLQVHHPDLGIGTIISASGFGPKRTVTVLFADSSQERTFRLSHASLTLVG
jgi:DNA helicase II / ATP-dependent DNA helicase PcrA